MTKVSFFQNYTMANPKQATNGSSQQGTKGTPEPKPATGAKNGVKTNEEEHHLPNGGCKNLVNDKYTNTNKQIEMHKYKYANTQIQINGVKTNDEGHHLPNGE